MRAGEKSLADDLVELNMNSLPDSSRQPQRGSGVHAKHRRFAMRMATLALATLMAAGCASTWNHTGNTHLTGTEKMMWSTYPLATQKGMATAFVVAKRDPKAPGGTVPVVVTSVHVLNTIGKRPLYIGARVPKTDGDPQVVLIELTSRNPGSPYYVRHPQHDIAAFELKMPPEVARQVSLSSCLQENELVGRVEQARPGDDISFLGYPEVLPGTPGAFPVLRSGKIASYPAGMLRQQRKFLVNADAYPGDSGAPVFATRRNGSPHLIGMIVQRIGSDRKKLIPLALAVDATAIRETLQLLDAHEHHSVGATVSVSTGATKVASAGSTSSR